MDRRIAQLGAQVEQLQRRPTRDSRNSSLRSSQNPTSAPPRRSGPPSSLRRRGPLVVARLRDPAIAIRVCACYNRLITRRPAARTRVIRDVLRRLRD